MFNEDKNTLAAKPNYIDKKEEIKTNRLKVTYKIQYKCKFKNTDVQAPEDTKME